MAQFDGGKYNEDTGLLSYNYLGGEGGIGGGSLFIKQFKGKWHFVDESGKIRKDVGIEGKLTPTHIKNLEDDNIFAAANIDSKGEVLSDDIDAQEIIIPSGSESNTPLEDRSNLSLRDARGSIDYKKTLERRGTVPAPALVSKSPYDKGMIGSGYSENTTYIPDTVSLSDQTMTSSPFSDVVPATSTDPNQTPSYGSTFQPYQGAGQTGLPRGTGGFASMDGGQLNKQNTMENMSGFGGVSPSYQRSFSSDPAALDTGTLDIGTGGKGSMWDSSFYRTKDGTLMKDSGVFGEDTAATQADINAGIKDQASPGMTSADGWNAAGSVMKGVGGLASAYTGIKNYQLARDAHNTQKNQWQANYDQQLKAYQQNKDLANQDIQSRNRTLLARNKARTDTYKEL